MSETTDPVRHLDCELFLTARHQARLSVAGRDYSGRPALDQDLEDRLLEATLEPTRYGSLLFEALFANTSGDLLSGYRESLALARHQGRGLRFRLHIAATAPFPLHRLHWELLYDPGQRLALARSRQVAFSRYLGVPLDPGTVVVARPRLLVALANPHDLADYALPAAEPGELRRAIERALAPLADRVDYHILEPPTTVERIRDHLVEGRFHALHLHAHGVVDDERGLASLVLEDASGHAAFVDESLFSEVFEGQRDLRLVTLVACHGGAPSHDDPVSGLAPALVRRGIPAVIAMRRQITLTAASRFGEHLYRNLARDARVDVAVGESRQQLYLAEPESPEWSIPLLFMRQREGLLWRPGAASEEEAHEPPPRPPGWQPTPGLDLPWRPHWRIEHQLGAGGFGEAWLAAHRKTGEKRVFKFCWEAPQLRALQREITLFRLLKEELGDRMDIARILDWDFDRIPYSIESDYAALGNLAEWAEARGGIGRIPLATRLEIVAQVATALAAAHSVGILHKDVKPTNILVVRDDPERDDPERDDGEGLRVQLADFGIGALTEPDRLAAAGITALGLTTEGEDSASGSGTRLYMAPELLEGKRPTLQADIYALGVLLYQMLTGDFSRALASGWQRDIDDELLRHDLAALVDGSPGRRPGDALRIAERLRSLASRREQLAEERRRQEVARQARQALARSRRRRKLMAAVFAILLVFAGSMGYLARRLAREAERTRLEAERANREALLARETVDFLKGLFEVSNPAVGRGETVTARELLDRGSERIRHGLGEQPLSRALLMDTMGTVYQRLGLYDSALPLLEEALALRREQLGDHHPEVATSLVHLAKVRRLEGYFDEARPLFRQALDIFEHSLGPDHPGLVPTLNGLGATAWAQGRHDEAEQYFRRALDILEEAGGQQSDPDLARTLNNLGMLASTRGRYEEAETSYGRALDILEQTRDVRDPELATALENLGIFHAKQGHYEEAVRYYRRTLAIWDEILEPDHPQLAKTLNNLAASLQDEGQLEEAETLFRRVLEIRSKTHGSEHPSLGVVWNNLADVHRELRRHEEAERGYRRALEIFDRTLPPDHRYVAYPLEGLARLYRDRGDVSRAETFFRRALRIREEALDPGHPETQATRSELATLLEADGREAEAFALDPSGDGPAH